MARVIESIHSPAAICSCEPFDVTRGLVPTLRWVAANEKNTRRKQFVLEDWSLANFGQFVSLF